MCRSTTVLFHRVSSYLKRIDWLFSFIQSVCIMLVVSYECCHCIDRYYIVSILDRNCANVIHSKDSVVGPNTDCIIISLYFFAYILLFSLQCSQENGTLYEWHHWSRRQRSSPWKLISWTRQATNGGNDYWQVLYMYM